MKIKKFHFKHLWLIFGAYGVWFAIFSGIEEISMGKWWKVICALVLGTIIYLIFENKIEK